MHKHPVNVSWKNEAALKEADHHFASIHDKKGGVRCQALIAAFIRQSSIFADRPMRGKGTTSKTNITIDIKKVKVATDADGRAPLTLLKLNGVALMLCRPDQEKKQGLLFKICPHDMVGLANRAHFDSEISRFNASLPSGILQQSELALAS
jgi:hypothetical protein